MKISDDAVRNLDITTARLVEAYPSKLGHTVKFMAQLEIVIGDSPDTSELKMVRPMINISTGKFVEDIKKQGYTGLESCVIDPAIIKFPQPSESGEHYNNPQRKDD